MKEEVWGRIVYEGGSLRENCVRRRKCGEEWRVKEEVWERLAYEGGSVGENCV